jgi:Fe2+ or Zn2+ uptake regulation protein
MNTLAQAARERLHEQGGRMTRQRRLILDALECLDCHPTAEELFAEVKDTDPALNLSTVYRTLRWLEQEGLVSARRFAEQHRQERFDPALPSEHFHFVCNQCQRVIEFDEPLTEMVKTRFAAEHGASIETISLVLYGVCEQCQEE